MEAADISETNGKCPLTRLPGHPRLLLPNCLLASLGGAAVATLISWENPAPSARLLLSDHILSLTPLDIGPRATLGYSCTQVLPARCGLLGLLALMPTLEKRVQTSPLEGGGLITSVKGSVIKAFDQDGGRRVCECASARDSECARMWAYWCMCVCVCKHVWTGEGLGMSVRVPYLAVVVNID